MQIPSIKIHKSKSIDVYNYLEEQDPDICILKPSAKNGSKIQISFRDILSKRPSHVRFCGSFYFPI